MFALQVFSKAAGVLPWGAGQFRVASRYAALNRWLVGSFADQRLRSGALVRLDLGDYTQAVAFLVRDYSPALTRYIVSRLPRGGVFFDVGGNVGLISFSVASLRPDVVIHAFEPNPTNATAWYRNQRLNRAHTAVLVQAAASHHVGQAAFTIPSDSASGTIRAEGTHSVPTTTLDTYCEREGIAHIDVLKIDVEGHEPSVLAGGVRMLTDGSISTILCEVSQDALDGAANQGGPIAELLCRHGFSFARIPPVGMRRLIPGSSGSATDVAFER